MTSLYDQAWEASNGFSLEKGGKFGRRANGSWFTRYEGGGPYAAGMTGPPAIAANVESLQAQVRRALIWRSGSQMVAQAIQWTATFMARLLDPTDYGLFAMAQVVLVFLSMLNGFGLASGLVRAPTVSSRDVRQAFGMLLAVNVALAVVQIAAVSPVAAYYHQLIVAEMLRVQALLYLTTPFIALPTALLSRRIFAIRHMQTSPPPLRVRRPRWPAP